MSGTWEEIKRRSQRLPTFKADEDVRTLVSLVEQEREHADRLAEHIGRYEAGCVAAVAMNQPHEDCKTCNLLSQHESRRK